MTVTIVDQTGQSLSPAQLSNLALWNDTMSHVCATVLTRVTPEDQPSQAG